MNNKALTFILVAVLIGSVGFANRPKKESAGAAKLLPSQSPNLSRSEKSGNYFSGIQSSALAYNNLPPIPQMPVRKWEVLDPKLTAKAAIMHSLDDDIPLYYFRTHQPHPIASLTKLLTAIIVMENAKLDEIIPVSESAVQTEGLAGNLLPGEEYTAKDLLKMMLLTSSNDAAEAFTQYFGKEKMVSLLNKKIRELNMLDTRVEDASGLSDNNISEAYDLLVLSKYIINRHPQIFNWTRAKSLVVQPVNRSRIINELNINPLVARSDFLGGKTGTSPLAKENLISVFRIGEKRVIMVILGSENRIKDAETLINWAKLAYKGL